MSSSLGYSLIEGSESNNSTISKNNKTRRNKITRESLTENKLKTSNVSVSAFKEDEDENAIGAERDHRCKATEHRGGELRLVWSAGERVEAGWPSACERSRAGPPRLQVARITRVAHVQIEQDR